MKTIRNGSIAVGTLYLGVQFLDFSSTDAGLIVGALLIVLFVLIWLYGKWRQAQLERQERSYTTRMPLQSMPYVINTGGMHYPSYPQQQTATWADLPISQYETL